MPIGILTVSLQAPLLQPKERQLLAHSTVGGVVLFKENWAEGEEDPKAVLKSLIAEIRSINPNLIIMVDQEGGKVWRFGQGFSKLPAAKIYGELYDQGGADKALRYAYEQGYLMADELLACDIDLALAPVVDLEGDSRVIAGLARAFHRDPQIVVDIAEQFIRGMNTAGMPATIKHFPGHGTCQLDSHLTKTIDERGCIELQKDLLPFKALVEKKLELAVMSNHVIYPAVDNENSAGFSQTWLKGCLRMGCGFDGLIMSDCLSMKGADIGTLFERIQKAQKAGHDLILMTHQHHKNLEELLGILDDIPDSQDAVARRERFMGTIKRRKVLSSLQERNISFEETPAKIYQASLKSGQKNDHYNTHKGII